MKSMVSFPSPPILLLLANPSVLFSLSFQIALLVIFAVMAIASAQYYYGSPVVSSWPATGHWGGYAWNGGAWNGAYASPYAYYLKK